MIQTETDEEPKMMTNRITSNS